MGTVRTGHPQPGVTTITLSRPEALNALTAEMVRDLDGTLDAIASDRDCRVVVLTGEGRGFCAGLDLKSYGDEDDYPDGHTAITLFERQGRIARLAQRLHQLPQPVIAAVNGPAAGGGLALACASDIRLATTTAVFAVSFIQAGYSACDIGVSWLLPRIVGTGRAHELMLTGRRVDAGEALRLGLVTTVVEDENAVMAAALTKANEIMRNPPFSVELTKQGMWHAVESPTFNGSVEFENRQQVLTAMTEDQQEAVRAFLSQTAPAYTRR